MPNSKIGLEVEFLLLDEAGQVVNSADHLLKHCRGKKIEQHVKGECSKCQIEIVATPKRSVQHITKSFLRTLSFVLEEAQKLDLWLYPLATYPGEMLPKIRNKPWYRMQQKMIGVNRWSKVVGSISGFHLHVDLPRGVVNWEKRRLKSTVRARSGQTLVNQYNFLIGVDPAICTITQSSPFFQGEYYCKDTRLALWRNLELPEIGVEGIYADMQIFGRLPYYANTVYDIDFVLQNSKKTWLHKLEDKDPYLKKLVKNAHPMRFYWGPLRVNKIGTFEQRGMDMNLPRNLFGVSSLIKSSLSAIAGRQLKVRASETAIKRPFKTEGNTIYIPPRSYVAHELTKKCILYGLADRDVYHYCKRFISLASGFLDEKPDISLKAVKKMVARRRTVSDDIMNKLKIKRPHFAAVVEQGKAAELALEYAEEFERDVHKLITHYILLDLLAED